MSEKSSQSLVNQRDKDSPTKSKYSASFSKSENLIEITAFDTQAESVLCQSNQAIQRLSPKADQLPLNDKMTTLSDSDEEGSDADMETGSKMDSLNSVDPNRMVYSLRELKKKDNLFYIKRDYIKHGYRAHENMTFRRCSSTLCMVHNETMNVYSHLIPGLYFLYQLVLILTSQGDFSALKTQSSVYNMAFGTIAIITCMVASSMYHLYNCMSEQHYFFLLRLDLIGIGVMIFGLTLCAVYLGFHNWEWERSVIMAVMGFLMVGNLLIQMTPCYAMDKFDGMRVAFYSLTLVICISLALADRFYYATPVEVEKFFTSLWLSFGYLGTGFWFYLKKYPEKLFKRSEFVQIWFNSHFIWHVFVALSGYTLFWMCYDFNLYVETCLEKGSQGSLN